MPCGNQNKKGRSNCGTAPRKFEWEQHNPTGMTAADVTIPRHVRRVLGPGTRTSRDEAHAQGTLHSGRDRPGTVRANLVGDLRFRVRSYVILKRLPIALLILYFLARQTDWQESLQGTNIRQSCLEFS